MSFQPDPNNRRRFRDDNAGVMFWLGDSTDGEGRYQSPDERTVII